MAGLALLKSWDRRWGAFICGLSFAIAMFVVFPEGFGSDSGALQECGAGGFRRSQT
jgi:hypothetical protein